MVNYSHGGDIFTPQKSLNMEILDYSTNLNPLGIPPEVVESAQEGCSHTTYPDPFCGVLREHIAEAEGVSMDHILCGNGVADLIIRLVMAIRPKKALLTAPTFSEYGEALSFHGCDITEYFLQKEEGFLLTDGFLDHISSDLDICFLCTPNNPTGISIPPLLMEKIIIKCRENRVRLVVDECFLALSTGGTGLVPFLAQNPHLVLLRAFTKSYAMAGLRLGYVLSSDESLLETISRCGQPWNVSIPAQLGGISATKCPQWTEKARELLAVERPKLKEGLEKLGFTVFSGEANFLLFQVPEEVGNLKERLLERGILIRSCGNFSGLNDSYYRVCVGLSHNNETLLTAFREVIS